MQNATTAQLPGALDAMFASAARELKPGVRVEGNSAQFKLWAPVRVLLRGVNERRRRGARGAGAKELRARHGHLERARIARVDGQYYRYAVEVFVRGTARCATWSPIRTRSA